MNLESKYLGLTLKNPVIASASPLSKTLDAAKRLEDAGVSAIVLYSLFEEQINHDQDELDHFLTATSGNYAEALSYFPEPEKYINANGEQYLEYLQKLKKSVNIPIIGSLNGVSAGGWIKYAKYMQDAGADAVELNIYYMATSLSLSSVEVEKMYIDDVKGVKEAISVPLAVKVGPYFSSFANFAHRLVEAGADGLVLFNRFFGPDIDLENLEVSPQLSLSTSWEMRLPLRWIAVLSGRINASLAATSGVKNAADIIKLTLAGADVAMIASILFEKGVDYAKHILTDLQEWLEKHEYNSLSEIKGSMNYMRVAEPAAYERANYMKTLQSYE